MKPSSPALTATLQALYGESDPLVVAPALGDIWFARVLALAPNVDPLVGALGALAGWATGVLSPAVIESPDLAAAVASLTGTAAGVAILGAWAEVAPIGWGATHAAALIDAVQRNRCASWAAAALIGPGDVSAALLHESWEIAIVIRRWGQTTPDDPTAWMDALTPTERDRLLDALRADPAAAFCLPWLPTGCAETTGQYLAANALFPVFAAYTAASPVARARHGAILSALMQRTNPYDLDALTRLAVASHMDGACAAVVRLLSADPRSAVHIVAAAPWDDVHPDVQTLMLSAVDDDPSGVCAAIAFARGMRDQPLRITRDLARAFFAVVTPEVWNALPAEIQRAWCNALDAQIGHLAVRSLGIDPTFLACADLDDALIAAVRRHIHDDAAGQRMLLPVAVRDVPHDAVPAVVAALPMPLDPVAFVQIAGRIREMPSALRDWIATHPTPQALAGATTTLLLDTSFRKRQSPPILDRCMALTLAFAGWSSEDATALLAALPDDVRTALHPGANALADALAHPDRRNTFRQALDALAALPPATSLPSLHALNALAQATTPSDQRRAGAELAWALRDHEDRFLAIVDTLTVDDQARVFLALDDTTCAAALPTLAAIDPLVVHRLAHALQSQSPTAVLDVLATMPSDALMRIWRLMPETLQSTVCDNRDALLREVAAPGHADALAQRLQAWEADDPLSLLALRMLCDSDERQRTRGVALLAQHPDLAAALLPLLRDDVHVWLETDPRIAVACADIPQPRSPTPARRRRSREARTRLS
jgi:hypothetical protein